MLWRASARSVLVAVLLALLLPAASRAATPKVPRAEPVEARTNGTISKTSALKAFAGIVAPLPGVKARRQAEAPTSGTAALRWAMAWRSKMTRAQRRVLDRAVTGRRVTVRGRRVAARAAKAPSGTLATWKALAGQASSRLGSHFGAQLKLPVKVQIEDSDLGSDDAHADAYPIKVDGKRVCRIRVFPKGWKGAGKQRQVHVISHEMAHCFMAEYLGDEWVANDRMWLTEGGAEWAGVTVAQEWLGTFDDDLAQGFWDEFLKHPELTLSQRAYSAVGFWAQVDMVRDDVFSLLREAWKTDTDTEAYELIGTDYLESAATRLLRTPAWGEEWDLRGPAITGTKAPVTPLKDLGDGGSLTIQTPSRAHTVGRFKLSAEVVEISASGTYGRFRAATGEQLPVGDGVWCADPGGCTPCPGQSPLPKFPGGSTLVALAASTPAGTVRLKGQTAEDYCKRPGQPAGPAQSSTHLTVTGPSSMVFDDDATSCRRWKYGEKQFTFGFIEVKPDGDTAPAQQYHGLSFAIEDFDGPGTYEANQDEELVSYLFSDYLTGATTTWVNFSRYDDPVAAQNTPGTPKQSSVTVKVATQDATGITGSVSGTLFEHGDGTGSTVQVEGTFRACTQVTYDDV